MRGLPSGMVQPSGVSTRQGAERVRPDVALQVQNGAAGKAPRPKVGEKSLEVAAGNGRDVRTVRDEPLHLVEG